jgi:Carbohydrate-selective porin, OprB family/S-layer homology domain
MLPKVLWNSLLVAPAVLGAALIASASVAAEAPAASASADALLNDLTAVSEVNSAAVEAPVAAEAQPVVEAPAQIAQVPVAQPSADAGASLDQINQYNSEGSTPSLSQVTSVSQLSDVQPTDWAFQALQNLVERYGCIAGYPDGTYRGRQATTRYEFAAGLNACLDRVNELIAAGLADAVTREDLATLQRLQEEFAAELATLRGRVDALEARTAELEANQFSTTTVLRGETIFSLSGVFDEDEQFDDQIVFADRVRLNFDTSFTGEDRLRARLQARNVPTFAGDSVGFSYGGDEGNDFTLDDLYYSFPLGERVNVIVFANSGDVDDFVTSTISPLDSSASGSISDFGFPRQYAQASAGSGAGAGASIQLTDNFTLDFGYIGDEPNDPSASNGLFNGDYGIIGQLTFLSDFLDAAVTYINSYDDSGFDVGVYDVDGPAVGNTYGGQVNFKFGPFQIGGGGAYTDVAGLGDRPDYDLWSYQATLAINDLGGEGNQLGILAGIPPYTRDLPNQSRDTSFLAEVFYRFSLNDNISITPSVIWLNDPFNDNANSDTIIGTLRTTFRF